MDEIYLTIDLKIKYMLDFEKNVLLCEHPSWKIRDNLKPYLIAINRNFKIQTLYSAYPENANIVDRESYLEIAYAQDVEIELFRELSIISEIYCDPMDIYDPTRFNFKYSPSIDIYCENENRILELGCLADPDYFKINHIRITLLSNDPYSHDAFWKQMQEALSNI